MLVDAIARPVEPRDHVTFLELLKRGWQGSNGYHAAVCQHWSEKWPEVLDRFQAFFVVETSRGIAGFAGIQSHPIPCTDGLTHALIDHFPATDLARGEAVAAMVQALAPWSRSQGFARISLNLEPEEHDVMNALRGIGCFPERAAMFGESFPQGPADPSIRLMRPEEKAQAIEWGARIAEHLAGFPGSLGKLDLQTYIRLTEEAYRDYGATRAHTFFVAEREGRMVGYLFVVMESDGLGLLYDSWIEPEYRRDGLYRALICQGSEWLKEQGAVWLTASVFVENKPPFLFLTKEGFFSYFVSWELNL